MSVTIRRLGETFSADRKLTREEAQALVTETKKNGIVSKAEKAELNKLIETRRDLFEPGALELLLPLVQTAPPATAAATVKLTRTDEHRPVYLSADGRFTVNASGAPPASAAEAGDALFRAGELVDDSKENVFSSLPRETREKALEGLLRSVSDAKSLPSDQGIQTRASAGALMLHLAEGSSEPDLRQKALAAYEGLIKAETFPKLRHSMIFHFSNSPVAQTGAAKASAAKLMTELAPLTPPYEKWFANGNKTVNMDWVVGPDEFWKNFTANMKRGGFKPVGVENQRGVTVYERTIDKPGVGETTFRVSVREARAVNLFAPINNPGVQIIGYDGHSNWGRNLSDSLKAAQPDANGGAGKLFLANLCVGKGALDRIAERMPNLQSVTTYGSSSIDTDLNMLAEKIAARASWTEIDAGLQQTSRWENNAKNFVTPVSTLTREKVLDRDNDGQADYLDKHFNYSTFNVPADTRREFTPVKQSRDPSQLDGTKVMVTAHMVNTLAEFSTILDKANVDSKVIASGWHEPKMGETGIARFEKTKGQDGKTEYRMTISSRYSHMSEEALRAVTLYEWAKFATSQGDVRLSPLDAKVNGIILLAHSLDTDEAPYRDDELWKQLLGRYNLPAVDRRVVQTLLDAEHHAYSGSPEMIRALKAKLSPELLAQLEKPEVGEPVRVIG